MTALEYNDLCLTTPEIGRFFDEFPSFSTPITEYGLMSELEESINFSTMVSMNDVCSAMDNSRDGCQSQPSQQPSFQQQYQSYNDNGYSSSSSFPASPDSALLNAYESFPMSNSCFKVPDMSAASPADSHLSTDSGASLYNLDQPIKSEPQDTVLPAIIEEINGQNHLSQSVIQPMHYNQTYPAQGQQFSQVVVDQSYSYQENNYMPSTVSSIQPMLQTQPTQIVYQQPINTQIASTSGMSAISLPTVPVVSRKRAANGAFASTTGDLSTSSGAKKQRLTKRQKQQAMDKQVEEYTQKNKDLTQQIELLERKVQFCTQFLQKYVSPIVRGQNTWSNEMVEAM